MVVEKERDRHLFSVGFNIRRIHLVLSFLKAGGRLRRKKATIIRMKAVE